MMLKKIKRSHIISAVLLVFVALMLFSPDSKAWVTRGLMKVGLFRPNLETPKDSEKATMGQSTSIQAARPAEAGVGNGLASVYFSDSNGFEVDAANQNGKVVFINFWAPWCPPCIAEMPSIVKLSEHFKDHEDVVFIIADVDRDLVKAGAFMTKRKFNLPVHIPMSTIPEHWLGRSIPTTVILDKNGLIAARHEGAADYGRQEVFDFIEELLAE